MTIYLVSFAISILFAYEAKRAKTRFNFVLLSIISIVVPALLAGLRDISIGIDTKNYYELVWLRSVWSRSFFDYFNKYVISRTVYIEPLFMLLAGIVEKTTGSYPVFLFCIHLIIVGCVYIGAFRLREHADPIFVLFLFYLLYYNYSLNISRQFMAMAIIFAELKRLEERKYFRYFFVVYIASLFHSMALLGIIPGIGYMIVYPSERKESVPLNRRLMIAFFIVAFSASAIPLFRIAIRIGLLGSRYLSYFRENREPVPMSIFLMLAIEGAMLVFFWKVFRSKHKSTGGDFYLFCSLLFLALYAIAPFISYGKRVAQFFALINIVTIAMGTDSFRIKRNRQIISALAIVAVAVYWLYFYVYLNGSQTVPYVFGV